MNLSFLKNISNHANEAIWRYKTKIVQAMISNLTAPSHYLSQCWEIIYEVYRQSIVYENNKSQVKLRISNS